jgi:predicted O-methyltransferase YrrM
MAGRPSKADVLFDTAIATAVDEYTFEHIHKSSPAAQPTIAVLDKAYANQVAGGLPDIAVSQNQGKYLQVQARIANAKNILELGTLGGYSTLFLVHTSPETKVTTIEYSTEHARVAQANFKMAGVADRVTILEGAGVDVLPRVLEEYKAGKLPPFDFTFIDADKQSNWIYVDLALQMSRPGAVIIVDNVVRNGGLVDPAMRKEPKVVGSREVIEKAGVDPRLECSLLQTVGDKNYDGMLICVKL